MTSAEKASENYKKYKEKEKKKSNIFMMLSFPILIGAASMFLGVLSHSKFVMFIPIVFLWLFVISDLFIILSGHAKKGSLIFSFFLRLYLYISTFLLTFIVFPR